MFCFSFCFPCNHWVERWMPRSGVKPVRPVKLVRQVSQQRVPETCDCHGEVGSSQNSPVRVTLGAHRWGNAVSTLCDLWRYSWIGKETRHTREKFREELLTGGSWSVLALPTQTCVQKRPFSVGRFRLPAVVHWTRSEPSSRGTALQETFSIRGRQPEVTISREMY